MPEFRERALRLLPDSAGRLVSTGTVGFRVVPESEGPQPPPGSPAAPPQAWTEWDKDTNTFTIAFLETMENESDEMIRFLWYHELGHIVLGHFRSVEPCGPPDANGNPTIQDDWLISADINVNWMLQSIPGEAGEAYTKLIDDTGSVNARTWLEHMKLGQQTYPFFVVHDILHNLVEQEKEKNEGEGDGNGKGEGSGDGGAGKPASGFCGGIEATDDPSAIVSALGAKGAASADDSPIAGGLSFGTGAGDLGIKLTESDLPDWLPAVERFARSVVEVTLADGRTHKRPQPTLASAGVRVPSLRPTYKSVPSVVCLLVDTSGSMMGELRYVAPVLSYLKANNIGVRLIAGDTRVTFDELVDKIPDELPGAGGTEITPLFDRAAEYDPKAVVCFTDGYVPSWPKLDEVDTLWVGTHVDPPYGEKA